MAEVEGDAVAYRRKAGTAKMYLNKIQAPATLVAVDRAGKSVQLRALEEVQAKENQGD